jgi:hypothetical protein
MTSIFHGGVVAVSLTAWYKLEVNLKRARIEK